MCFFVCVTYIQKYFSNFDFKFWFSTSACLRVNIFFSDSQNKLVPIIPPVIIFITATNCRCHTSISGNAANAICHVTDKQQNHPSLWPYGGKSQLYLTVTKHRQWTLQKWTNINIWIWISEYLLTASMSVSPILTSVVETINDKRISAFI